jgi:hypothetical protein
MGKTIFMLNQTRLSMGRAPDREPCRLARHKTVAIAHNLRYGHRPMELLRLLEQLKHTVGHLHCLGEHRCCGFGHDVG